MHSPVDRRLCRIAVIAAGLLCSLSVAPPDVLAQYGYAPPRQETAKGEAYHIEFSTNWWNPTPVVIISSESLGIPGTEIDFVSDLGIVQKKFGEIRLIGKAGRKHKFSFNYIPIKYEAATQIQRTLVFNGIRFNVNVPVSSELDWNAYRFGYEWDFVSNRRGFVGVLLEAKYTDVTATLTSPVASEFAHAEAPIPAIGGIGRVYFAPGVSFTGEMSGFKLPDIDDGRSRGHYLDYDFYGTVNFTNNVGAQFGYRSLDIGYVVESDAGTLKLEGWYFGGTVRF